MSRYEEGLRLIEKNCVILAIRITRDMIFRDHGAVRYNMDFVNKLEIEEGKIR